MMLPLDGARALLLFLRLLLGALLVLFVVVLIGQLRRDNNDKEAA